MKNITTNGKLLLLSTVFSFSLSTVPSFGMLPMASSPPSQGARELASAPSYPTKVWAHTSMLDLYKVGPDFDWLIAQGKREQRDLHSDCTSPSKERDEEEALPIKSALFNQARIWNVDSIYQMGHICKEEGNLHESFEWYLLGLFCKVSKTSSLDSESLNPFYELWALLRKDNQACSTKKEELENKGKKGGLNKRGKRKIAKEKRALKKKGNTNLFCITVIDKMKALFPFIKKSLPITEQNLVDVLEVMGASGNRNGGLARYYNLRFFAGSSSPKLKVKSAAYKYTLKAARIFPGLGLEEKAKALFHYLKAFEEPILLRNMASVLEEKGDYIQAAQLYEKSGSQSSHALLGQLYLRGQLSRNHLDSEGPLLKGKQRLILATEYLYKSKMPRALNITFDLYSIRYITDSDLEKSTIDAETFRHDFFDWVLSVESGENTCDLKYKGNLYLCGIIGRDLSVHERQLKAEKCFEDSERPDENFATAGVLYAQGRFGSGPECLKKALEMYERSGQCKNLRSTALIYQLLGKSKEAEEYALQAQAVGFDMADVFEKLSATKDSSSSSETEEDVDTVTCEDTTQDKAESVSGSTVSEESRERSLIEFALNSEKIAELEEDMVSSSTVSEESAEKDIFPEPDPDIESFEATEVPAVVDPSSLPLTIKKPSNVQSKKERKKRKKERKTSRHRYELGLMFKRETERLRALGSHKEQKWAIANIADVVGDTAYKAKVQILCEDIVRKPWVTVGECAIGKPEILKGKQKRYGLTVYSRHINPKFDSGDRLTYVLHPQTHQVYLLTWEGHYKNLDKAIKRYKQKLKGLTRAS